ncbi:hypothetical protein BHC43_08425 [Snodgrassella alvi]|nr:hypothetical protein BHC43_08425 [Snodgrassella alvi]
MSTEGITEKIKLKKFLRKKISLFKASNNFIARQEERFIIKHLFPLKKSHETFYRFTDSLLLTLCL